MEAMPFPNDNGGFLSPVMNRGNPRKPFGEVTNTPPRLVTSKTPNRDNPPTPMSNLKLLMRVAAEKAEEQKPSRRELFKDEQENDENKLIIDYVDHDYSSGSQTPSSVLSTPTSTSAQTKVSRKDKSLGLLCDKFISRFPKEVPSGERCEIPLDDLAKQMNTERRRIYDIVNVLEAVQMMTKVGKNLYQWHGTTHQLMTLAWLRQLATKLNLLQRYRDVKAMEAQQETNAFGLLSPRNERDLKRSPLSLSSTSPASSTLGTPGGSLSSCSPSPSPIERKTSLGVACQKFLMLFLIVPEAQAKINLDIAAKVIHGIGLPDAIMKTRIRRLYDIANILQSLKLIQKVQITESHGGKKPAFQYIGPVIEGVVVNKDVLQTLPSTRQRHSLLTFGKNLLDLPDQDPREGVSNAISTYGKKRSSPDGGFDVSGQPHKQIRVTTSVDSSPKALNLVKRIDSCTSSPTFDNFAVPLAQIKRSNSLMELSDACEAERDRFVRPQTQTIYSPTTQHLLRLRPIQQNQTSQRQLFKSPVDQRSKIISPSSPGISLLKRALTSPQDQVRSVQFIRLQQSPTSSSSNLVQPYSASHSRPMRVMDLNLPGKIIHLVPKQDSPTTQVQCDNSNSPKDLRVCGLVRSSSL